MSTEAKVKGQKGRKPSTKPNTVFTGVMRRASNGQSVITIQYNDADGNRHKADKALVVINNEVAIVPFVDDAPAAGEATEPAAEITEEAEATEEVAAPVA